MTIQSGLIPAGFTTINDYIKRLEKRYGEILDYKAISDFLKVRTSGVLVDSFAQFDLKSKKLDKAFITFIKKMKSISDKSFIQGVDKYIDSGGFQVLVGLIPRNQLDLLINYYFKMVEEEHQLFDKIFALDIPYSDMNKTINGWDDIKYFNNLTYNRLNSLPDEIRNKIIYIDHYGNERNVDIFEELYKNINPSVRFKAMSVGSLSTNSVSKAAKNYMTYMIIPIVKLVKDLLKNKISRYQFHFLGRTSQKNLLFYTLVEYIIKIKYGIDFKITFDSALYKSINIAKTFHIFNGSQYNILDFRTVGLENTFKNTTVFKYILNELNTFIKTYKLGDFEVDRIYDDNGVANITAYLMLHLYRIETLGRVNDLCTSKCPELYQMILNKDDEGFSNTVYNISRSISDDGIVTKQLRDLIYSMRISIEYLLNLDIDTLSYIARTTTFDRDPYIKGILEF